MFVTLLSLNCRLVLAFEHARPRVKIGASIRHKGPYLKALRAPFRGINILYAVEYCSLVFSLVANNDVVGAPDKILPRAPRILSVALAIYNHFQVFIPVGARLSGFSTICYPKTLTQRRHV